MTTRKISDVEFERFQKIQGMLHAKGYDISIDEIWELMSEFLLDKADAFVNLVIEKFSHQPQNTKDKALESLLFDEIMLPDNSKPSNSVFDHDVTM